MTKSSKLLHLDPLAIALEKRRKQEEAGRVEAESAVPDSRSRLSSQLTEQPRGGPVSNQPRLSSQPRSDRQPNLDNHKSAETINLLASLPDIKGEARISHRYSDHLCQLLTADEQAVYWQLYRLSWGWGKDTCFISNPRLSQRSNVSLSSMKRAVAGLVAKGLAVKTGHSNGYGKDQGVEYRVLNLDNQPTESSQPRLSSQPNVSPIKVNTHKENTQTPDEPLGVRVGSKYSSEECRAYAESLKSQGITNPGGYATTIYRSGEADEQIGVFLRQRSARVEKAELSAEQIQEQVNVVVSRLQYGSSIQEVEQSIGKNFRAGDWIKIRSMALAQVKVPPRPAGGD
jgi:Helix-turn-helix domain